MRVIHLVRKPISEGSVVANAQRWETGGINIDACRLQTADNLNGGAYSGGKRNPILGDTRDVVSAGMWGENGRLPPSEYQQPTGRWPANLILEHLPSCVQDGTKRVKPHNESGVARQSNSSAGNRVHGKEIGGVGLQGLPDGGYVDVQGLEEVTKWSCADECPTKALDEQTGVLTSGTVKPGHMRNNSASPNRGGYHGNFGDMPLMGYGDSGGASRFFKQVQDWTCAPECPVGILDADACVLVSGKPSGMRHGEKSMKGAEFSTLHCKEDIPVTGYGDTGTASRFFKQVQAAAPSFIRAVGTVKCEQCGLEYRKHPEDTGVLDSNGEPWLNVLCDGTRVKL